MKRLQKKRAAARSESDFDTLADLVNNKTAPTTSNKVCTLVTSSKLNAPYVQHCRPLLLMIVRCLRACTKIWRQYLYSNLGMLYFSTLHSSCPTLRVMTLFSLIVQLSLKTMMTEISATRWSDAKCFLHIKRTVCYREHETNSLIIKLQRIRRRH